MNQTFLVSCLLSVIVIAGLVPAIQHGGSSWMPVTSTGMTIELKFQSKTETKASMRTIFGEVDR